MNEAKIVTWIVCVVAAVVAICFFLAFSRLPADRDVSTNGKEFLKHLVWREAGLVGMMLFGTIALLAFSFAIDKMKPSKGSFGIPEADFFEILAFLVGVLGAIYGLLAKRAADEAFQKSNEVHQAITSFFGDYHMIMTEDEKIFSRSIPCLVKKAKRSLTFFLGSPLVGYLRDPTMGEAFKGYVMRKLSDPEIAENENFRISLIAWDDAAISSILPQREIKGFQLDRYKTEVTGLIQYALERDLAHLPKGSPDKASKPKRRSPVKKKVSGERLKAGVWRMAEQLDPGFRFVISDSTEAIFWILEDPTLEGAMEEGKSGNFQGGGFSTDRTEMIKYLEGLFLYHSKKAKPEMNIMTDEAARSKEVHSATPSGNNQESSIGIDAKHAMT